jgi:hypothetical protein
VLAELPLFMQEIGVLILEKAGGLYLLLAMGGRGGKRERRQVWTGSSQCTPFAVLHCVSSSSTLCDFSSDGLYNCD